ncbi:hypothetical protein BDV19DRAFT_311265 [Aspergillus venezuelensis]
MGMASVLVRIVGWAYSYSGGYYWLFIFPLYLWSTYCTSVCEGWSCFPYILSCASLPFIEGAGYISSDQLTSHATTIEQITTAAQVRHPQLTSFFWREKSSVDPNDRSNATVTVVIPSAVSN